MATLTTATTPNPVSISLSARPLSTGTTMTAVSGATSVTLDGGEVDHQFGYPTGEDVDAEVERKGDVLLDMDVDVDLYFVY